MPNKFFVTHKVFEIKKREQTGPNCSMRTFPKIEENRIFSNVDVSTSNIIFCVPITL